jgi:hypothetical protein
MATTKYVNFRKGVTKIVLIAQPRIHHCDTLLAEIHCDNRRIVVSEEPDAKVRADLNKRKEYFLLVRFEAYIKRIEWSVRCQAQYFADYHERSKKMVHMLVTAVIDEFIYCSTTVWDTIYIHRRADDYCCVGVLKTINGLEEML